MNEEITIPITVKETSGIERIQEPVSISVPFPKGKFNDISHVCLVDENDSNIPCGETVLSTWFDGSIKWVLVDFQISVPPNSDRLVFVRGSETIDQVKQYELIKITEDENELIVNTGQSRFHIDKKTFRPFKKILIDGEECIDPDSCETILTDPDGITWVPIVESYKIESSSPLKTFLYFDGTFSNDIGTNGLKFKARLSFYANHSFTKIDFTLWNPQAAEHPGNFWDLGNSGSIHFKDLSVHLKLSGNNDPDILYNSNPLEKLKSLPKQGITDSRQLVICQDSSGGENWQSRNHVSRDNKIPLSFKGFKIFKNDETIEQGLRATPTIAISNDKHAVAGTIKHFWENFPSSLRVKLNNISVSPFPGEFNDLFEFQGGEQKTCEIFFDFSNDKLFSQPMPFTHLPLLVQIPPSYYCETDVFSYLVPKEHIIQHTLLKECFELSETVVKGNNNFLNRREIIDEYGWRNFGDQYADHENRLYLGEKPIISHYNNQYDLIRSFTIQYACTGDPRWFKLANELALHVIDIDIYHTDKDIFAYNHGLFWHTDHFASAGAATHRSFSKETIKEDRSHKPEDGPAANYLHYGSGPSPQHVYTQGLLYYYFLTGNKMASDAMLELAEFVMKQIDGPDKIKPILKEIAKTSIKWVKNRWRSKETSPYGLLDGPDRGSGNALSVLLDAYTLTKKQKYLLKAEYLIKKCVHPDDNLEERRLSDINTRWSYTVFFQSVGKYLDIKYELGTLDYMFCYARKTLIHYALWMVENEVFIMTFSGTFDFPNYETRVANDFRKPSVLYTASTYCDEKYRDVFRKKAKYFLDESIKTLLTLETRTQTRPLAIMMQNMHLSFYYNLHQKKTSVIDNKTYDFGLPEKRNTLKWLILENFKLAKNMF